MKRILATIIIGMLALGFNVLPAEAYTNLATPVAITAEANITGVVETFSAIVIKQSDGTTKPKIIFGETGESVTGPTADSGEALEIKGGTNQLNARLIIYTDVNNNSSPSVPSTADPAEGIDGGGMVGQTEPDYSVALLWGVETADSGGVEGPNRRVDYTFDGNPNDGVNEVYIVDKRHTHSFCTKSSPLDNNPLYYYGGAAGPTNTADDGLYPQLWDQDLYNSSSVFNDTTKVSPALYSSIATIAFGMGYDGTDYFATVSDISTAATDDTILAKWGTGGGSESLYYYVAGNFVGKPAQAYSTDQLNVALVKD